MSRDGRIFASLAAIAACLATLIALSPIRRYLSKIGGEPAEVAMRLFNEESLLRLGLGALWIGVSILLYPRRPRLAARWS